jgi:predicted component of type VI protein secretion system
MQFSARLLDGSFFTYATTETSVVVGRSPKCQFVIADEGISRQHVLIEYQGGDLYVTDLGSTNGVMIDGEQIDPQSRTLYLPYLNLSFGSVQTFTVSVDSTGIRKLNNLEAKDEDLRARATAAASAPERRKNNRRTEEAQGNKNSLVVNIIAAIVTAAIVFYTASKIRESVPENEAVTHKIESDYI